MTMMVLRMIISKKFGLTEYNEREKKTTNIKHQKL